MTGLSGLELGSSDYLLASFGSLKSIPGIATRNMLVTVLAAVIINSVPLLCQFSGKKGDHDMACRSVRPGVSHRSSSF